MKTDTVKSVGFSYLRIKLRITKRDYKITKYE